MKIELIFRHRHLPSHVPESIERTSSHEDELLLKFDIPKKASASVNDGRNVSPHKKCT